MIYLIQKRLFKNPFRGLELALVLKKDTKVIYSAGVLTIESHLFWFSRNQ